MRKGTCWKKLGSARDRLTRAVYRLALHYHESPWLIITAFGEGEILLMNRILDEDAPKLPVVRTPVPILPSRLKTVDDDAPDRAGFANLKKTIHGGI